MAPAPAGTRILVVDDDPDLLDMLMGYFLTAKFEVDTATNGARRERITRSPLA